MLKFKFTCVFLFFAAFVRANEEEYLSTGDFKTSTTEMKLNFQNLKEITLGLRQKLEPEFNHPSSQRGRCPIGFVYLPLAQSCYKVVYESDTWESADIKCQHLHKGSHLAAITSVDESNALKSYLRLQFETNPASAVCYMAGNQDLRQNLWTSGQRLDKNSCIDPFVWKLSTDEQLPFTFTDWNTKQPDCQWNKEQCVHLIAAWSYRWNDVPCSNKMCALCEYQAA